VNDRTTGGGGDGPRYRLDGRIATGGMGEVWRATDRVLGRQVAVKVLKHEYADDPMFRSRFETEARNAAALHHPNVASIFDFGELPATEPGGTPQPYLVMELVRGEPLSALLRGGEPMPAATAAGLVAQAADALAAAHDLGIVHRDVKPANLLVTPDRTVKITDFGIARAADAVALTQTGQVIGTPQYLSPEQAEGRQATPASDVYSLGVVLYECLAGRRPFDGDSPIATALAHLRDEPPPLPDDVPESLRETVRVALAKDPAARFASVRDLASALRGGPVRPGAGATQDTPTQPHDAPTRVVGPVGGAVGGAGVAGAGLAAAGAEASPRSGPAQDAAWDADGRQVRDGDGTRAISRPPPAAPAGRDGAARRRRLPAWLPWVAAAAAVLVIVFLLTRLAGDGGNDPTPSGPSTSAAPSKTASDTSSPSRSASPSATTTATVQVVESDYLGRPKEDVEQDLVELGLSWRQVRVENPGDEEADTVADVSPSGRVNVGTRVTVSYYGEPAASPTPTTSPSATATASPSAEPTDTGQPDENDNSGKGSNGNGNGGSSDKGKGKGKG
jgi:tRNA A-37 threonylcarbamoyl transferase component Bud32